MSTKRKKRVIVASPRESWFMADSHQNHLRNRWWISELLTEIVVLMVNFMDALGARKSPCLLDFPRLAKLPVAYLSSDSGRS